MSRFKTMPGDLQIQRAQKVVVKANPYRDGATGRFTTGGAGGGAAKPPVKEGDLMLNHFEKAVDKAYGTGEEAFSIAHTGDQSTAALGHYLGAGHTMNDRIRKHDFSVEDTSKPYIETDNVKGLDHAIDIAPPIPNKLVYRTTSADAIRPLKKGGIYMDEGFTSTTAVDITHPDNGILLLQLATVSPGKKSIMEINTSKGKGIYMPRMFPGQPIADFEKEFLMPRSTKMKYLGPDYRFIGKDQILEIHRFKVVD
jgi:hypothetical protein